MNNDFGDCEDGAIVGWEWLINAEVMMSAGMALRMSVIDVARSTTNKVYHDTFAGCDNGMILESDLVQYFFKL